MAFENRCRRDKCDQTPGNDPNISKKHLITAVVVQKPLPITGSVGILRQIEAYAEVSYTNFFKLDSGKQPVRKWLLRLERGDRQIIGTDIQKVEFGWPIGMPYSRKLEKGLWEVRSNISSGRIARVLFTIQNDQMILLHGFVKKTQTTPDKDKKIARIRIKGTQLDD